MKGSLIGVMVTGGLLLVGAGSWLAYAEGSHETTRSNEANLLILNQIVADQDTARRVRANTTRETIERLCYEGKLSEQECRRPLAVEDAE